MIKEIILTNFRCFSEKKITFSPGVNLFVGKNGSGKTSILESIYLLGRGRSFRTNYLSDLILKDQECAFLFLSGELNEMPLKLGSEIKKSSLVIKANNTLVQKRSDLLDYLPLQIITPTSHELIDSGPNFRRKFIDWGLFHVEHNYRTTWSLFKRVLKQRNQLLKQSNPVLSNWDSEFIRYSSQLTGYRAAYFEELTEYFLKTQEKLFGTRLVSLNFFPGWNTQAGLEEELKRLEQRDRLSGWSHCGPQKADIKFAFLNNQRNVLSRGQQKMMVFALQLAQCLHLQEKNKQSPLLLIDDISSELDKDYLNNLFKFIHETGLQSVVSAIDQDKINKNLIAFMFHVEH